MLEANQSPLKDLDELDELRKERDSAESQSAFIDAQKKKEAFRDYDSEARASVKEFYRLNHKNQTVAFAKSKQKEYLPLNKKKMRVWEALEYLNTLVDDSDPDTDATQIEHLMQTSESIRKDGHPRWFILAGLLHDLGKILCLYGEPQWAVVGDTFPIGCAYSDKIVYSELLNDNPDKTDPVFSTKLGMYEEGCGLDNVNFSWGHDEYIYHVLKDYLPEEALYMLRYHSCYPIHKEREYSYLMNDHDKEMFEWVRAFNQYDLYSKSLERPNIAELRPFYDDLISEYCPSAIRF